MTIVMDAHPRHKSNIMAKTPSMAQPIATLHKCSNLAMSVSTLATTFPSHFVSHYDVNRFECN